MTEEVVLVTGVSGYLGCHVAKQLLEGGWRVRGTVRDLSNTERADALKALCPEAKHPLELVEVDLTKDDGWDKAVLDCKYVISCATVKGKQTVEGLPEATTRLLTVCAASKTVSKLVLTSCHNTIAAEADNDPEKVFTEEDWTSTESPTLDHYSKSKVLAEKLAWDFVKELPEEEKFDLIVMNPALILGPALLPSHKTATSIEMIAGILNKSYPGVPKISLPICDVRDAAKAHVEALSMEDVIANRHIICTKSIWMKDMANMIAKEFKPQGYSIATCQLPNFVVWVAGLFNRQVKNFVLPRLGKELRLDNSRMTNVLKIEPTPIETTIQDMAYSLIDIGIVHKAKKYKQTGSRAEVPEENGKEHEEKELENGTNGIIKEKELEPEDKEEKTENNENKTQEKTNETENNPEEVKENGKAICDKDEAKDEEKKEENEAEK